MYSAWETDKVIATELARNLALAMVCVFLITLIFLVNLKLCFLVLLTVILTLVDILGIIYFWGLTIDTVVCMGVVLVVGLCVDYSAHIAHSFCVAEGTTSQERATFALVTIGPAIFNGGTTTFLALVFLSFSNSYAYVVMFKARMTSIIEVQICINNIFCRCFLCQSSLACFTDWSCYLYCS
jgi:Niemann-Pick C1 protein